MLIFNKGVCLVVTLVRSNQANMSIMRNSEMIAGIDGLTCYPNLYTHDFLMCSFLAKLVLNLYN